MHWLSRNRHCGAIAVWGLLMAACAFVRTAFLVALSTPDTTFTMLERPLEALGPHRAGSAYSFSAGAVVRAAPGKELRKIHALAGSEVHPVGGCAGSAASMRHQRTAQHRPVVLLRVQSVVPPHRSLSTGAEPKPRNWICHSSAAMSCSFPHVQLIPPAPRGRRRRRAGPARPLWLWHRRLGGHVTPTSRPALPTFPNRAPKVPIRRGGPKSSS